VKQPERDPDKLWLDRKGWYLEIQPDGTYIEVHEDTGNNDHIAGYVGPEVLLQTKIVKLGDKTEDGDIVKAVGIPWLEIFKQISKNPDFLFVFAKNPRRFEEFIAGAYREAGFDDVTLTPASGDKGRDVIAVKNGLVSIKVLGRVFKLSFVGRVAVT
jgi:hypothetical protein